jgi:flagellar hook assembly protein FlgD
MSPDTIAADAHLYDPQPAVKWRGKPSRGSSGTRKFVGATPPYGATIYYSLGTNARYVGLQITDIEGRLVRELEGETSAGLHQLNWDLRRVPRQSSSSSSSSGRYGRRGSTVSAGKYLITLIVNEDEYQRVLTVEDDPDAAD